MVPVSFRAARAVLRIGSALYLALLVSVVVRFLDVVADLRSGSFVLFDDNDAGLSRAMVGALWDQFGWLWAAVCVWWPIAMGVLVVGVRRAFPETELRVAGSVVQTMLPMLTPFTAIDLFRHVGTALETALPDDPTPARIMRLSPLVPASCVVSPVLLLFALAVFSRESPSTVGKVAVLVALGLPFVLPWALRALQLRLLIRSLAAVEERLAADAVRAQRSEPVAG